MTICVATSNAGKLREIEKLFVASSYPVALKSIIDLPSDLQKQYEPIENADSYAGNALIKARALAALVKEPVIAEDSGFEVEALKNSPGVFSNRFAENDKARIAKILDLLAKDRVQNRGARFVACFALLVHGKNPIYFFGKITGLVALRASGDSGFGYDPIFIPTGERRTWAEMSVEEKNQSSHRSRALNRLIQYMIVRDSLLKKSETF